MTPAQVEEQLEASRGQENSVDSEELRRDLMKEMDESVEVDLSDPDTQPEDMVFQEREEQVKRNRIQVLSPTSPQR